MAPIVHGGIYPEAEGVTLGSRELRVLIDPGAVSVETADHLREIDVLRHYLRDIPGQPCSISLLAPQRPDEDELTIQLFRLFNIQVLPLGDASSPAVRAALGFDDTEHPGLVSVASAAAAADADLLVTLDPAGPERADAFKKKLHVAAEDWTQVKRSCETFARGHEVPWAFSYPAWWWPWIIFYSMTEPRERLLDFHRRVVDAARFDVGIIEYLRSLMLNRHAMLCYTRDKLLFYILQRRAAERRSLKRQEFLFEAAYFLNHYYLLLWGGLDQLALVLNGLFELGVTERRVGFQRRAFQKALKEKAPNVAMLFNDAEFQQWVRMLAAARHLVAHRGVALPQKILLRDHEVSTEELDRKIEQLPAWQRMVGVLGKEMIEEFRTTWRYRMLLEEYEAFSEPGFEVDRDGKKVLIFPLVNVEWDFENFFCFAERVVAETQHSLGLAP
jgi:hypothetical protein